MNMDLMSSSEDQGWQTPPEWLERIRAVAPIALDPCTRPDNPTGAENFICPPEDALLCDWKARANGGMFYSNSPYGDALARWAPKQSAEGMRGHGVSLAPARTDTGWFRRLVTADAMCFVAGRIKFFSLNPLTGQWERGAWSKKKNIWVPNQPAPFPSLFCYWGPRADRFREVFGPHGWCP